MAPAREGPAAVMAPDAGRRRGQEDRLRRLSTAARSDHHGARQDLGLDFALRAVGAQARDAPGRQGAIRAKAVARLEWSRRIAFAAPAPSLCLQFQHLPLAPAISRFGDPAFLGGVIAAPVV